MRHSPYQPEILVAPVHVLSGPSANRTRPLRDWRDQALANFSDAVIALSSDFRITYFNHAAEQLYGCTADSVLGRSFHNAIGSRHGRIGRSGSDVHITHGGVEVPVRVSFIEMPGRDSAHRYVAIIRNDRESALMRLSAAEGLQFENLLSDLAARFSRFVDDDVDAEIELWLRRLAENLDVERASFAHLTRDGGIQVTHVYAAGGAPTSRFIAHHQLPWLIKELSAHRVIALSRIDDLRQDAIAERQYFASAGVRCSIQIPICIDRSLTCVLAFSSSRERCWHPEITARLQLVGGVFASVLDRKQAKQKLAQKQHELAHVSRVAAMGELASVIAHELDQPLTAVVSNAQAIRYLLEGREPDLAEADEALKDIIDAAMRISEITQRERRLLKKSEEKFAPADLNEIIREIELFIRGEARQFGSRLSIELQPGLPKVLADRVQLLQVILNLTRNGFQAMADTPRPQRHLRVRTSRKSGEVVMTATDSGPGVEELQLEQMFEPFFTTKPEGLGMGLAISRTIIEHHRGRIWATRAAAGGLTMHVAIPQMRDHHES